MQIQFSLIKKKKRRLDIQNTRYPPPPTTLPTSNNILFLPYSPTPVSKWKSYVYHPWFEYAEFSETEIWTEIWYLD